jgi:hypothetical protein
MKALIAILLIVSLPAYADVQCKKFPSTEPGPIVIFKGSQCPLGWQPA